MTGSAMMSPPVKSKFCRIRSGLTLKPEIIIFIRANISPVATHALSVAWRICKEVARSASCSVCMASRAKGTCILISEDRATISCAINGFLFCGIVLEPTEPSGVGSSNSPNSCFWRV